MADDDAIFHYPGGAPIPAVHPGATLRDEIKARSLTANSVALALRVPANRLTGIIRGERGISAETALRLGRFFGTGAAFWVNLQARYDLAIAERDLGKKIASEVKPAA